MAIIDKVYIEMHSGKQTQTDTTTEESEVWLHLLYYLLLRCSALKNSYKAMKKGFSQLVLHPCLQNKI